MKLIIAGSRTLYPDPGFITECMCFFKIPHVNEVVSGTANGVDKAGEEWFDHINGVDDKILTKLPADWGQYGKSAGHIRNAEMAAYADALLLIWDGESKGSANMKLQMKKLNKPIYEVILKRYNE